MRTAGVRELKSRLSAYLREVKDGETVLVTEHGNVVARLSPPVSEDERSTDPSGARLRELIDRGRVRAPTARRNERFPARPSSRLTKKDFERLWNQGRDDGE
jgi:prevent-host-death family protein